MHLARCSLLRHLYAHSVFDLGSATPAQVEELSNACQPATFGRNQEDVLDETYRKAGKLDSPNFLWGFNPDSHDFADKIVSRLFSWQSLDQGIRFELYKLNVYGKSICIALRFKPELIIDILS